MIGCSAIGAGLITTSIAEGDDVDSLLPAEGLPALYKDVRHSSAGSKMAWQPWGARRLPRDWFQVKELSDSSKSTNSHLHLLLLLPRLGLPRGTPKTSWFPSRPQMRSQSILLAWQHAD